MKVKVTANERMVTVKVKAAVEGKATVQSKIKVKEGA